MGDLEQIRSELFGRTATETGDVRSSLFKTEVPSKWVQGSDTDSLWDKFVFMFDDPHKEAAKASNALVNAETFDITPAQAYEQTDSLNQLLKTVPKPKTKAEGGWDEPQGRGASGSWDTQYGKAFTSGAQQSVAGTALTLALKESMSDFEATTNAEELMQGLGQLLPDLPLMFLGSGISNVLTKIPTTYSKIAAMGGAFALPAGLRKVYIDKLQKGEIEGWGDYWGRLTGAVKETVKGEVTGMATGGAAAVMPFGLKTLAEVGTMTTVGSMLEGRIPEDKDFMHALVMVGGLKFVARTGSKAKNKFQDLYVKHNADPMAVAKEINERAVPVRSLQDMLSDLEAEAPKQVEGRYMATEGGMVRTEPTAKEAFETVEKYRQEQMDEAFRTEAEVPVEPAKVEPTKPPIEPIDEMADLQAQAGRVDKKEYERAIKKLVETDLQKANESWQETQEIEQVGQIIKNIEAELAAKETPKVEPKAGAPVEPPKESIGVEKQPKSPEQGKGVRGVTEILSDINDALGTKGAVGDFEATAKQKEARERLKNDMKIMAEEANARKIPLGEYLNQQGIDKDTAHRLMQYAPDKIRLGTPAEGDIVKQRNLGTKKAPRYAPPVTVADEAGIKALPDVSDGRLTNPIYTFDKLGDWAKDTFYHPMKAAEDAAKRHFLVLKADVDVLKKELPKGSADRIGIYATAQQKGGAAKLKHMGIEEVPTLTKPEMDAYNRLREHYKDLYDQIQEARIQAGKEPFDAVDDYFTFMHEISFLDQLGFNAIFGNKNLLKKTIDDKIAQFIHRKATPFRFAQKRTNALYNVDTNAFRVFLKYSDTATEHIAKSPVIAKGRELLLKMPDDFILQDKAPDSHKFLTEWLDFQAGQKPTTTDLVNFPKVEAGLKALNRNMAFAVLGANLRSALIQPTSLLNTVTEIGQKYTRAGIAEMFNPESVKFAMKESNVLLTREFDVNVTDAMRGIGGHLIGAKEFLGTNAMKPLQYLDLKAAQASWLGAFEKGTKFDGMTQEQAVKYADETVVRTQASAARSDMAPVMRSTLGRTALMFQTFTLNNWNFLKHDVAGIGNERVSNKQAFEKVATFMVGATLINILFEDILGTNSPLPTPLRAAYKALDEGDGILGASKNMALELGQLLPFFGGARYGSHPLGATVDFIGDVAEKFSDSPRGKPTAELVGKGLGVPGTAQIKRLINSEDIRDALFGKKKD
jgi:hypothetical protein